MTIDNILYLLIKNGAISQIVAVPKAWGLQLIVKVIKALIIWWSVCWDYCNSYQPWHLTNAVYGTSQPEIQAVHSISP